MVVCSTPIERAAPANVFVCSVKLGDGYCDRYRVDRNGAQYRARVLERHGNCTLPAG